MVCPYCNNKTRVSNSRAQKRTNSVWRRRCCKKCYAVFTSEERLDLSTVWLVEDSSTKTSRFSRDKLFLSVYKSLPSSPQSLENAGMLTDTVLKQLLKGSKAVLSTQSILHVTEGVLSRYSALAALKYASKHTNVSSKRDVSKLLKQLPLN